MPINFKLEEQLAGFVAHNEPGGRVAIQFRELIGPSDSQRLSDRLEVMQRALFGKITSLPEPSRTDHLVVVINPDLTGVAYANELDRHARVQVSRAIAKGELLTADDIDDIDTVELACDVPDTAAVVVVRASSWKRSLFYDFGPLLTPPRTREYSIERALAQQLLLLYGIPSGLDASEAGDLGISRIEYMRRGLSELQALLTRGCAEESRYQELIERPVPVNADETVGFVD